MKLLANRARFVLMVVDGKLVITKKDVLMKELEKLKFDKIAPAKLKKKKSSIPSAADDDDEDSDDNEENYDATVLHEVVEFDNEKGCLAQTSAGCVKCRAERNEGQRA